MEIEDGPRQKSESSNESAKENPKVRNIELDDVPEVNALVQKIASMPTEERLGKISDFIKSKFKSAMPPNVRELPESEREKINKVFDQKTPKKLSECLELEYGVCLDYNALGKAIFDKLGIPAEFKIGSLGSGPRHTYLDIEIGGSWRIFDPFAEVYMQDRGSSSRLFHEGYYAESRTRKSNQR